MTKLQILSQDEINKFNIAPDFDLQEKQYYFKIPKILLQKIELDIHKIHFIAIFGYFKATNILFHNIDIDTLKYIAHSILDIDYEIDIKENLSTSTLYRYKTIIKEYFNIQSYNNKIKDTLLKEATTLASNFTHRKRIFVTIQHPA